jgi:hypothetical protein
MAEKMKSRIATRIEEKQNQENVIPEVDEEEEKSKVA